MSAPAVINSNENISKLCKDISFDGDSVLCESPSWLTKKYLQQCLRAHYGEDSLKVNWWQLQPALGKGENYGGVLTRVCAEYQTCSGDKHVGHYIVKTSFEKDELVREVMAPYDIFNREMSIYEDVLPKLNDLLQEIGDNEQIFAETLAVDKLRSALVFEDLNKRDFVMPDRTRGLDMPLIRLVLRKLAKMHAASAVLNERENGCLESYDRGFFNRHTESYKPIFLGLFDALTRLVNEWDDFKFYAHKLSDLRPHYMELGKRVFEPIKGHVNVLAHGDLWTNNVLVKYDKVSGDPIDVIIIDFQYAAWGSPALDLYYLFNTSLPEELHVHRQAELIQHYYRVFEETLRKLNYRGHIPSLHGFHMQLESKEAYAFHSTCVVQPVQRNEVTDDADIRALLMEDERAINFKNTCYKNPYCQRVIRQLLPVYERKGLLDVDQ